MAKTFEARADEAMKKLVEGNGYSAGKVSALCKQIASNGRKLDVDTHAALVASLGLIAQHGDCNTLALVLNSMPKSARTATAATWAEKFAPVKVTLNQKTKAYSAKLLPADERFDVQVQLAFATPFWTKPEKVDTVWTIDDFADAVARLIKKAEGNIEGMDASAKQALADLRVVGAKLPSKDKADA